MNVEQLIELLKRLPQDTLIVGNNPDASDEGLGHCYESVYLHLTYFEKFKIDNQDVIKFTYSHQMESSHHTCQWQGTACSCLTTLDTGTLN